MDNYKNFVLIAAGGRGLRMKSRLKKQYMKIKDIPVLTRTIMAFTKSDRIHEIVLAVPENDIDFCYENIIRPLGPEKSIHVVKGGKKRSDSVSKGLSAIREMKVSERESIVLVHDGVRPFIERSIIDDCIDRAIEYGACIPAIRINDTVKKSGPGSFVEKTLDRDTLYLSQTPQAFRLDLILKAFEYADKTSFSGTDEASFMEHSGQKVYITRGSPLNIKITTREDLVIAGHLSDQL